MQCVICSHEFREQIDSALLSRNWGEEGVTLKSISDEFKVPLRALQVHSVMHFSQPVDPASTDKPETKSITDKLQFREAEILRETANEYFMTLKNLGLTINRMVTSTDISLVRGVTSEMVTLYLGTGKNIRETMDSLVKMEQAINGDSNSGLDALKGLIGAINGSGE